MSEEKAEVTLKEFVDDNYHAIAVMGVFAALAAFFIRVENGEYLATLSFVACVLLGWELFDASMRSQISRKVSRKLSAFQIVLFNLFIFLAFYIVISYSQELVGLLVPLLLLIYGGAILKFVSKIKGTLRMILVGISGVIVGMVLTALISYLIEIL